MELDVWNWLDGWMELDGWMDMEMEMGGWTDGQMDRWTDGPMDGWIYSHYGMAMPMPNLWRIDHGPPPRCLLMVWPDNDEDLFWSLKLLGHGLTSQKWFPAWDWRFFSRITEWISLFNSMEPGEWFVLILLVPSSLAHNMTCSMEKSPYHPFFGGDSEKKSPVAVVSRRNPAPRSWSISGGREESRAAAEYFDHQTAGDLGNFRIWLGKHG